MSIWTYLKFRIFILRYGIGMILIAISAILGTRHHIRWCLNYLHDWHIAALENNKWKLP